MLYKLSPISFQGQNSHGTRNTATCLASLTKVVAPVFSFTNIYKSCHINHFLLRKTLVSEAVASTAGTSPLFCNGNSVCGVLLTQLNSNMSIFLYYLLEVYFILIDILYELYPLLVGQLTHEKILICLIFPYFSAIFA